MFTTNISVEEKIEKINKINLEPIMVKLMDKKDGKGWTLTQTLKVEKWYKRFLILCLKYPKQSIVPNGAIDDFWHYHILDTQKYAEDCQNTFGYFLHHFPYFGMRGAEDALNLENSFEATTQLYKKEFGESLTELSGIFKSKNFKNSSKCDGSSGGANDCGSSGASCTTSKCESGPFTSNFSIRPTLESIGKVA